RFLFGTGGARLSEAELKQSFWIRQLIIHGMRAAEDGSLKFQSWRKGFGLLTFINAIIRHAERISVPYVGAELLFREHKDDKPPLSWAGGVALMFAMNRVAYKIGLDQGGQRMLVILDRAADAIPQLLSGQDLKEIDMYRLAANYGTGSILGQWRGRLLRDGLSKLRGQAMVKSIGLKMGQRETEKLALEHFTGPDRSLLRKLMQGANYENVTVLDREGRVLVGVQFKKGRDGYKRVVEGSVRKARVVATLTSEEQEAFSRLISVDPLAVAEEKRIFERVLWRDALAAEGKEKVAARLVSRAEPTAEERQALKRLVSRAVLAAGGKKKAGARMASMDALTPAEMTALRSGDKLTAGEMDAVKGLLRRGGISTPEEKEFFARLAKRKALTPPEKEALGRLVKRKALTREEAKALRSRDKLTAAERENVKHVISKNGFPLTPQEKEYLGGLLSKNALTPWEKKVIARMIEREGGSFSEVFAQHSVKSMKIGVKPNWKGWLAHCIIHDVLIGTAWDGFRGGNRYILDGDGYNIGMSTFVRSLTTLPLRNLVKLKSGWDTPLATFLDRALGRDTLDPLVTKWYPHYASKGFWRKKYAKAAAGDLEGFLEHHVAAKVWHGGPSAWHWHEPIDWATGSPRNGESPFEPIPGAYKTLAEFYASDKLTAAQAEDVDNKVSAVIAEAKHRLEGWSKGEKKSTSFDDATVVEQALAMGSAAMYANKNRPERFLKTGREHRDWFEFILMNGIGPVPDSPEKVKGFVGKVTESGDYWKKMRRPPVTGR
ncbi:MAG: hypothetical protein V2A66_04475, partial [Pseudomonadota bacterium]